MHANAHTHSSNTQLCKKDTLHDIHRGSENIILLCTRLVLNAVTHPTTHINPNNPIWIDVKITRCWHLHTWMNVLSVSDLRERPLFRVQPASQICIRWHVSVEKLNWGTQDPFFVSGMRKKCLQVTPFNVDLWREFSQTVPHTGKRIGILFYHITIKKKQKK